MLQVFILPCFLVKTAQAAKKPRASVEHRSGNHLFQDAKGVAQGREKRFAGVCGFCRL